MLIQEITLQGILSFGPETPPLEMRPLNVLIGANGSGKSNLIEAIGLLRSAPIKLWQPVFSGGGVSEWIWKGSTQKIATLSAVISHMPQHLSFLQPSNDLIRHQIVFSEFQNRFALQQEVIEKLGQNSGEQAEEEVYRYMLGNAKLRMDDGNIQSLTFGELAFDQSILSQRVDPFQYRTFGRLAHAYYNIGLYRDWSFGRSSALRTPQPADIPADRLAEDFSNLGMFLNRLRRTPSVKKEIIGHLKDLYTGLDDFDVSVVGGTVEVVLTEGDFTIPARRLSDGTLRYLCLLAILCDPDPPKLVCIEEPELGLHPDLLPSLAKLLIEASERMQLIVTTHSDILVDTMSETPESVVVFEKHDGKTEMKRLETGEVEPWLEKYRLGELWIRGQIGGTRW